MLSINRTCFPQFRFTCFLILQDNFKIMVIRNVMSYSAVCIMSKGSCGHWGCCAVHLGVCHPRRFLWSLGILCIHFGVNHQSSQKVLVITGDVVLYILV